MAKEKIIKNVKEIKEQQKYYDFYKKLPKIIFWAMIVIGVIAGIVVESNLGGAGTGIIFCPLFGVVAGGILYFLIKVSSSVKIMQTEYLAIIAKATTGEDYEEAEQEIAKTVFTTEEQQNSSQS